MKCFEKGCCKFATYNFIDHPVGIYCKAHKKENNNKDLYFYLF